MCCGGEARDQLYCLMGRQGSTEGLAGRRAIGLRKHDQGPAPRHESIHRAPGEGTGPGVDLAPPPADGGLAGQRTSDSASGGQRVGALAQPLQGAHGAGGQRGGHRCRTRSRDGLGLRMGESPISGWGSAMTSPSPPSCEDALLVGSRRLPTRP
jgi:hypothetical protein